MYYYLIIFLLLCFLIKLFSKKFFKPKLKIQCLAFDLLDLQHNTNGSPRNLNGSNVVDKTH